MKFTPATIVVALALAFPAGARGVPVILDPGAEAARGGDPTVALDQAQGIGADIVRLRVPYGYQEWGSLDAAVAGAQARGMRVLLTPDAEGTIPTPDQYGEFVRTLGARYESVHSWSVWNEPALFGPLNPRAYRTMILEARVALDLTGHARDTFLIGESSPVGAVRYARAVLRGPRIPRVSGWSTHPYVYDPARPLRKNLPGWVGIHELPRLHSVTGLPIWITEFGLHTDEASQARGIGRVYRHVSRWPWVRSYAQYLLNDDSFGTGLLSAEGVPRPAYLQFPALTARLR